MGSDVKISVITPSFNQADYIERTIRSVIAQQIDGVVEHRIVDGGSTDGTLEILNRYRDHLNFTSEPDNGMSEALNKGFASSSGDILGWLNSDDLYLPGTLRKVTAWFDLHPECGWLYGNCMMIDENDREVRKLITGYKVKKSANFSYNRLLVNNFISQPAVFFRRSFLEKAGPIDVTLSTVMDYDLWLRMANLGNPGYINDFLACFRVHGKSISARNYRFQFEEQYSVHRRYDSRKLPLLRHRLMITAIVSVYSALNMYFCSKDWLWQKLKIKKQWQSSR